MEYRVLGPIEALDGERRLPLGGPKQRALLGVLLMAANRGAPRDELLEALWPEGAPATAATALQVYVSRLRKLLPAGALETQPPGYVLHVRPGELDLERFEHLAAAGMVSEALELWRGPPLGGLELGGSARVDVQRLEERRLAVLEDRVEADLALGRPADLIAELEALVARYPLRERLRGQLMLALYRSGRQAEALSAELAERGATVERGLAGALLARLEPDAARALAAAAAIRDRLEAELGGRLRPPIRRGAGGGLGGQGG